MPMRIAEDTSTKYHTGFLNFVADFSLATLIFVDFSYARLQNVIIVNPIFTDILVNSHTSFQNAIIDDPSLIKYLIDNMEGVSDITKIPARIRTVEKLEERLKSFQTGVGNALGSSKYMRITRLSFTYKRERSRSLRPLNLRYVANELEGDLAL